MSGRPAPDPLQSAFAAVEAWNAHARALVGESINLRDVEPGWEIVDAALVPEVVVAFATGGDVVVARPVVALADASAGAGALRSATLRDRVLGILKRWPLGELLALAEVHTVGGAEAGGAFLAAVEAKGGADG